MKQGILIVVLMTAALALAPSAWAEAPTGFGIAGGYGSSEYSFPSPLDPETFSGPALALDFQFGIGDLFSVGPLFQYFYEEGEIDLGPAGTFDVTAETMSIGAQARVWLGGLFLGGHLARYNTTFDVDGDSESDGGTGVGLVAGWEANGGLFAQGQVDSFTLDSDGGDTDVLSIHAMVGFRFK